MNLGSITGNADKLGYLAGLIAGSANGINDIISSLQQLTAGVIHAPDFTSLQTFFSEPYFQNALWAYIGGVALEMVPIGKVKTFAKPLQKGAQAYGVAAFANKLLYSMTHSEIKGENVLNSGSSKFLEQAPVYNYQY